MIFTAFIWFSNKGQNKRNAIKKLYTIKTRDVSVNVVHCCNLKFIIKHTLSKMAPAAYKLYSFV